MKRFNISTILGTSALAASLAVLPATLPASAQTDTTTGAQSTNTDNNGADRDFDWGWLGLLGLVGLAGLTRKPEQTVRYRDTDEVSSTSSRY